MSAHASVPNVAGESRGYETRDLTFKPYILFVVGLVVLGVLGQGVIWFLFRGYADGPLPWDRPAPLMASQPSLTPPEPAPVQPMPANDFKRFAAEQALRAETYGWVNREAGVVRVPLSKAKEMVIDKGLPVRKAAPK